MFLKRVIASIEKLAPLHLADSSWDNVGLLIEAPTSTASSVKSRVFLTIDLTSAVLQEATRLNASVIIAYHPPIFRPFKRLTLSDPKQSLVLQCVAAGISVYSPHTALDNCCHGVNDWLASGLMSKDQTGSVVPIKPLSVPASMVGASAGAASTGGEGVGRLITLNTPTPLSNIVDRIKQFLNLKHVRVATNTEQEEEGSRMIRTVAICAGSGASVLNGVASDLYLTGEMGHHDVLAALAQNTSVVLCEHSNTERGYLREVLKPWLENDLAPTEEVIISQLDRDPLIVW